MTDVGFCHTHFGIKLMDWKAQRKPQIDGRNAIHLICTPKGPFPQLYLEYAGRQVDLLDITVVPELNALSQCQA
jgi:hypothetical protein